MGTSKYYRPQNNSEIYNFLNNLLFKLNRNICVFYVMVMDDFNIEFDEKIMSVTHLDI